MVPLWLGIGFVLRSYREGETFVAQEPEEDDYDWDVDPEDLDWQYGDDLTVEELEQLINELT